MNWNITYLPTTVRGILLFLCVVIDGWSRKVVSWEDASARIQPLQRIW